MADDSELPPELEDPVPVDPELQRKPDQVITNISCNTYMQDMQFMQFT